MNFLNPNTYTNPNSHTRQNDRAAATSNRASRNRSSPSRSGSSPFQNNDLLSALKQLVQHLLKQLQPRQDKPSDDTPDTPSQDKPLSLSSSQRDNIKAGIGFVNTDNVYILDQDASGTVSAGDLFRTSYIPTQTGEITGFEKTLSANDAAMINGEFGSALQLDENTTQQLRDALNTPTAFFSVVFDRDGSGTLSSGDVASDPFKGTIGSTLPPQFPSSYVTLEVTPDGQISRKATS